MNKFLEKLQGAEEGTKLWITIGTSATAGLLVVWLWLGYFNTIVSPAPMAQGGNDSSISFVQSAKGGLAFIGQVVAGQTEQLFGIFRHILLAPRSIDIQPSP